MLHAARKIDVSVGKQGMFNHFDFKPLSFKSHKFMNYRVAKDNAVSELIDPANITGASFGFCLESDCVPQPDILFMTTN
jgi:hypothetical protein